MTTILPVSMKENTVKEAYHCATLLDEWQEERNTFGQETVKWETQNPLDDKTTYKVSYVPQTEESVIKAKPPPCFCAEAPKALLFYHGDFTVPCASHVTISEMSYTNPAIRMHTNEEILDSNEQDARKTKMNELRRSLGLTGVQTKATENDQENENDVLEQERRFIRTLRSSSLLDVDDSSVNNESKNSTNKDSKTYMSFSIPPIGRVATRDRLLTTKQVSIDATGIYATTHADTSYPLTSSVCIGPCMKSKDNPMCKTHLR